MAGHDDTCKAGKFRAVLQWGFSSWQGVWGEYAVGWRTRHFSPVGMNESSQTRQWQCCCKVVLSVVGKKLMSFFPQNKEFLNTKIALRIMWISSALGTYLWSQWFVNGVRKVFLPTVFFRGLFLWGMPGTLVIIGFFWLQYFWSNIILHSLSVHRRSSKEKEDECLWATPLANISLSQKLSRMWL